MLHEPAGAAVAHQRADAGLDLELKAAGDAHVVALQDDKGCDVFAAAARDGLVCGWLVGLIPLILKT